MRQRLRHLGQRAEVRLCRIGAQVKRRERGQPGVLVRREDAIRFALAVQDFVALENYLVLEVEPRARLLLQRFAHGFVACLCVGFFVVVGEDGVDVQLARQIGNRVAGVIVHDGEVAAGFAQRAA